MSSLVLSRGLLLIPSERLEPRGAKLLLLDLLNALTELAIHKQMSKLSWLQMQDIMWNS